MLKGLKVFVSMVIVVVLFIFGVKVYSTIRNLEDMHLKDLLNIQNLQKLLADIKLEKVNFVTNEIVSEKLTAIQELATYSFEYEGVKTDTSIRQIAEGFEIPGTRNSVEIQYKGIIKVGYDIADVRYEIDNERMILVFYLPHAKLLDNYIDMASLEMKQRNNILNPISVDQVQSSIKEIQKEELERAIKRGLYDKAENQMKTIITNFFSKFEDYKIVFDISY